VTTNNQTNISAYDLAQKTVQAYAPLIKGSRLTSYRQPEITVQSAASCHPDFAALIKALCAKLDLNDRTQFSDEECQVFRYHRFYGMQKLYQKSLSGQQLLLAETHHNHNGSMLYGLMAMLLGEKVLSLLDQDQYDTWFPWNDFQYVSGKSDRQFAFRCVSLPRHVTPDGRSLYYYSAKRHTVTIRGKTRIVAFAPHAIQRIAERIVSAPRSYADLGDIFAFVNHCQYFEPALLYPQQDAFSFFDICAPGYFSAEYARHILDHLNPQTKYAYRVGYCPVVEEGAFFLAKTVLLPGYNGTPEYGVLRKASLASGMKERMLECCERHSYATTLATQDFSLLRWFHTHGVPQVISYTTPLFDRDPVQDPGRFNLVRE
jgi:hypothetical protein